LDKKASKNSKNKEKLHDYAKIFAKTLAAATIVLYICGNKRT
jgi:hypothetical protein